MHQIYKIYPIIKITLTYDVSVSNYNYAFIPKIITSVKGGILITKTNGVSINSLRPRQNGRLFADDTFKRIFLNENIRISTKNSLKFVPKGFINTIPALVLIMVWRRQGDKPLFEPMLVRSLTHICVTRPQWVNCPVNPHHSTFSGRKLLCRVQICAELKASIKQVARFHMCFHMENIISLVKQRHQHPRHVHIILLQILAGDNTGV